MQCFQCYSSGSQAKCSRVVKLYVHVRTKGQSDRRRTEAIVWTGSHPDVADVDELVTGVDGLGLKMAGRDALHAEQARQICSTGSEIGDRSTVRTTANHWTSLCLDHLNAKTSADLPAVLNRNSDDHCLVLVTG